MIYSHAFFSWSGWNHHSFINYNTQQDYPSFTAPKQRNISIVPKTKIMKKQPTYRPFWSSGGPRGIIPKNKEKRTLNYVHPKYKQRKKDEHTSIRSGTVHSELSVRPDAVSKKSERKR